MQASLSTLLGRGKPVVNDGPAPMTGSNFGTISPEAEAVRLQLVKASKERGTGMRGVAEYVLEREAPLVARITELETLLRAASVRLEASRSVG